MANAKARNVIIVDTSAAFAGNVTIKSIKYIGNTSGTASIKEASSSGQVIWEEAGDTNVWNSDVHLKCPEGIYVDVTNSAKVYIYTA